MSDEFSYTIEQSFGVLSTTKNGWTVELNAISWNGRPAKYDIRSWSPDHQRMGKGISLTKEELLKLGELIPSVE